MNDIVNLIQKIISSTSRSMKVCLPGVVQEYDYKTQKASIKIDIKELFEDNSEIEYPVVSGVPVLFTATNLASITIPVATGDSCLVLFADRDISNWLLGASNEKTATQRAHNLSDAIAIVGLMQYSKVNNAENNEDVLIRYKNAKVRLKNSGKIEIMTSAENVEITTDKEIKLNCVNANIVASENVEVTCENSQVNANNEVNIVAANSVLVTSQDINIAADTAVNLLGASQVNVNSENITITSEANTNINCVDANITASNAVTLTCVDANVTASNNINSTAVKLVHNGNLELNGILTVNGSITVTAGIVNTGGTIESRGIVLDTHTHGYLEAVAGSSPTAVTPKFTTAPSII